MGEVEKAAVGAPGPGRRRDHRGGRPGFVKVAGETLTIPDYSGNYYFNTLGNFLVNPKAGLVFIDFATGELLMLTGTVEILWEDEPEVCVSNAARARRPLGPPRARACWARRIPPP